MINIILKLNYIRNINCKSFFSFFGMVNEYLCGYDIFKEMLNNLLEGFFFPFIFVSEMN